MGRKVDTLLWNRRRIFVNPGVFSTPIDTGLVQPNTGFANYSPNEPALVSAAKIGSRVQVIPMAPTSDWFTVLHGEPYIGPNGNVWVNFFAPDLEGPLPLNVLFWDPHSIVGPGDADDYDMQVPPLPIE